MGFSEKLAYLDGLVKGSKIEADSEQGRLLSAMMDVLYSMAEELEQSRRTPLPQETAFQDDDRMERISNRVELIHDNVTSIYGLVYDISERLSSGGYQREAYEEEGSWSSSDVAEEEEDNGEESGLQINCPGCDRDLDLTVAQAKRGNMLCPYCGMRLLFDPLRDEEDEEEEE